MKQLYGKSLPIIGLEVNGNALQITMPEAAKLELVNSLDAFCQSSHRTLCQCQALAGYVNWVLNVFPRLRPGLASLYAKMGGDYHPNRSITLNAQIRHNLLWLTNKMRASDGIFLFDSIAWRVDEANLTFESDACLTGFAFWCVELDEGYYSETLTIVSPEHIFFHEAYAIVCALHWACHSGINGLRRVIIRYDNTNTVNIFHSLKATGIYNHLLQFAVSLLMHTDVDLRVIHIPGDMNCIADHLSRFCFDKACILRPSLKISQYQPPAILAVAAA